MLSIRVPVPVYQGLTQLVSLEPGSTISSLVNSVLLEVVAGFPPAASDSPRAADVAEPTAVAPQAEADAPAAGPEPLDAEPHRLLIHYGDGRQVPFDDHAGIEGRIEHALKRRRELARPGATLAIQGLPTACR